MYELLHPEEARALLEVASNNKVIEALQLAAIVAICLFPGLALLSVGSY